MIFHKIVYPELENDDLFQNNSGIRKWSVGSCTFPRDLCECPHGFLDFSTSALVSPPQRCSREAVAVPGGLSHHLPTKSSIKGIPLNREINKGSNCLNNWGGKKKIRCNYQLSVSSANVPETDFIRAILTVQTKRAFNFAWFVCLKIKLLFWLYFKLFLVKLTPRTTALSSRAVLRFL